MATQIHMGWETKGIWFFHFCCYLSSSGFCVFAYVGADRNRVSAWCIRRRKEAVQHWDGAHHITFSAVSG